MLPRLQPPFPVPRRSELALPRRPDQVEHQQPADGHPVLGADPDVPNLVYATGHFRNGILLAPLTGESVAALVTGEPIPADLSPFSADRFGE